MGYETHNSLLNLGSIFIFGCIYALRILIFLALKLVSKISKKKFKYTKKLKDQLFWSEGLSIFLETFFELVISGYFSTTARIVTSNGEIIGYIVGIGCLVIALVLLPLLLIYVQTMPVSKYSSTDFKTSIGQTLF